MAALSLILQKTGAKWYCLKFSRKLARNERAVKEVHPCPFRQLLFISVNIFPHIILVCIVIKDAAPIMTEHDATKTHRIFTCVLKKWPPQLLNRPLLRRMTQDLTELSHILLSCIQRRVLFHIHGGGVLRYSSSFFKIKGLKNLRLLRPFVMIAILRSHFLWTQV